MNQGFCSSALGQSVYLRTSKDVKADERGLRLGLANSFLTLGQVVGSFTGAFLAGYLSSSSMFVVMSGFFGAAAVLVANPVQETKR